MTYPSGKRTEVLATPTKRCYLDKALNHPTASPCPELDAQSFQAVDDPGIPVDAPTLQEVRGHQETKVWPCCRTRCDNTRNAEASQRSNQPHSSSTVCQRLGYWQSSQCMFLPTCFLAESTFCFAANGGLSSRDLPGRYLQWTLFLRYGL